MTDTVETLHARMRAAAEALDFEEAQRLRDMIALVLAGASPAAAAAASDLESMRQQPGNMGLGTGQNRVEPPPDWKPPPKPDPMTSGRSARRR